MQTKRLALKLLEWHGGQGSAVYSIGSCLLANKDHIPSNFTLRRAVSELQRLKADANYPECVTPKMEEECNQLAKELIKKFGLN